MFFALYSLGKQLELHEPYYIGLAVAAGLAVYHQYLIRHREQAACFKAFLHNNWLGAAIFAGLAVDYWQY